MNLFAKFTRSRGSYKPVAQDKSEEEAETEADQRSPEPPRNYALIVAFGLLVCYALGIAISASKDRWASSCRNPHMRQEWTSLSANQQQDYVNAVQCLMEKPSQLHPGTYRYDDFVYTRTKEGTTSDAAAFLAWHRYFIHLYEKALQDECGFEGSLPYWDWTLDWKDLSAAPIWDTFGGDGDSEGPITVHNGRCVSDGPFANHTSQWESIKVDDEFQTVANPHCLSRGFVDGKFKDVLENRVSPTSVNELVRSNDYSHFYELLEASTRYAIPQFINGDFFAPSAPNDPVFFLHHAQLDRIWWMWQQADKTHRYNKLIGPKEDFRHIQNGHAFFEDVLSGGDLGDDVQVKDMIRLDTGQLCYRY